MSHPGPARRALGDAGEDRAAQWYAARGFEVLDRNWRSRTGELDLVAGKGDLLVFCEVKARRGVAYGQPFEAVTVAKQRRLRRLAAEWLRARRPGGGFDVRFDVASVLGGHIEVLEGAF